MRVLNLLCLMGEFWGLKVEFMQFPHNADVADALNRKLSWEDYRFVMWGLRKRSFCGG